MIRFVGTVPDRLNDYQTPQKVIFTVKDAGHNVYIAMSRYILTQTIQGNSQGVVITSASGSVALDFQGEVWWAADGENIHVDVLEGGAL